MATTTKESALKQIDKKFSSMTLPGITASRGSQEPEIGDRGEGGRSTKIWQSQSNLCGMATFFNTLATDDPYLYAYFVCGMYRCGAAYLGYTKESKIVKASKTTRSSTLPPGMPTADWVALASLRDHLNDLINYSYNMGIPFLKDIPVLGFLGSPKLIEPLGGINWPGDLYNMLKAVGYTKVANNAASRSASPLRRHWMTPTPS